MSAVAVFGPGAQKAPARVSSSRCMALDGITGCRGLQVLKCCKLLFPIVAEPPAWPVPQESAAATWLAVHAVHEPAHVISLKPPLNAARARAPSKGCHVPVVASEHKTSSSLSAALSACMFLEISTPDCGCAVWAIGGGLDACEALVGPHLQDAVGIGF